MSGYNYLGPVPQFAVGFIPMYHVYDFQSSTIPLVSADGNLLVTNAFYQAIDLLGQVYSMAGQPTNRISMLGFGNGPFPIWLDNLKRVHGYTYELWPAGYWSGATDNGDYISDPYRGGSHVIYGPTGDVIFRRETLMGPTLAGQGTTDDQYLSAWNSFVPGSLSGVADGGIQLTAWAYCADDEGLGPSPSFYCGIGNSIYHMTTGPGGNYNGLYVPVDMNASRWSETIEINGVPYSGATSYRNGVYSVFNNAILDGNPYAANFSSNAGGGDYSTGNGQIFLPGINTGVALYQDIATGRPIPIRMAQDIYFAAVNSVASSEDTNGFFRSEYNAGNLCCIPTRLLNSSSYGLTIYQPGLAINESMTNTALTEAYPEMQLPSVGFFGSDGSVQYYNVLPFQFELLDISQGPDLMWVSPQGYVFAVYHTGNLADGNYSLWIGGSRSEYQSGVTNYRLPVYFGG